MVISDVEIKKLSGLLTKEGIAHETFSKSLAMGDYHELIIPSKEAWAKKKGISVSINSLTFGHADGLLELWDGKKTSEPVGYLTAEKALDLIRKKVM